MKTSRDGVALSDFYTSVKCEIEGYYGYDTFDSTTTCRVVQKQINYGPASLHLELQDFETLIQDPGTLNDDWIRSKVKASLLKIEKDPNLPFGFFSANIFLNYGGSVDYDISCLYAGTQVDFIQTKGK